MAASHEKYATYESEGFGPSLEQFLGQNTLRMLELELNLAGFEISKKQIVVTEEDIWGPSAFRLELVIGSHALIIHCSSGSDGDTVSVDFSYADAFEADPDGWDIYHEKLENAPANIQRNSMDRHSLNTLGEILARFCEEIVLSTTDTHVLVQASSKGKGAFYFRHFKHLVKKLRDTENASRFQYAFFGYEFTAKGMRELGIEGEVMNFADIWES